MRIQAFFLVALILMGTPATAQAPENTKFRAPRLVADLLDYCGEALNVIDTHPTQVTAMSMTKYGWCLGWVQAMEERADEVRVYWRFEEMKAQREGKPAPAPDTLDKEYLDICFPPDLHIPEAETIRAILRGLQASHNLQEPKNRLTRLALKQAYPCPAPAKDESKPAEAKP